MIQVEGLSKRFKLYRRPSDRLREVLLRRSFHHVHEAVRAVSFEVASGETLGIIGKNGAGKSTLLKLLTGVLQADTGTMRIDGRMTGLLELGTGFDMEQTGLQNLVSNGLLLGMQLEEIAERRADIIAFSELGEYIGEPLRTYSSGMVMRLAFAIAIHAEPQCFVVDEALSVGDAHFQQKCMRRIRQFRDQGGSIIFVSHDLNAVKMLCDRTLVLDAGEVVYQGDPEQAVNHYNRLIADQEAQELLTYREQVGSHSFGSGECEIARVRASGADSGTMVLSCGEQLLIELDILAHERIPELTIGIMLRDRFGQDIFGVNTHHLQRDLQLAAGDALRARFALPAEIAPGKYTVTAALHDDRKHTGNCYHWCDNVASFEVAGIRGAVFSGVCRLATELTVETLSEEPEVLHAKR